MANIILTEEEWEAVAVKLQEEWGEPDVSDESETNIYDCWLQDMTVGDIIDFIKNI